MWREKFVSLSLRREKQRRDGKRFNGAKQIAGKIASGLVNARDHTHK